MSHRSVYNIDEDDNDDDIESIKYLDKDEEFYLNGGNEYLQSNHVCFFIYFE